MLTACLSFFSSSSALCGDFPPFLPFPERLPSEIRSEVVSVWRGYTLTRAVNGQSARPPLDLVRLFIDLPVVTVAASRHLGLANYQVRQIGPTSYYEVEDGEGARGTYRVLFEEPYRRVFLASGGRPIRILGQVTGAALTVLIFRPEVGLDGRPWVAQRVETFVRVDNTIPAFFARILAPLFPGYVDRKIGEGFNIMASVSGWAYENPRAFCHWLGKEGEVAPYHTEFSSYCGRTEWKGQ